LNNTIPTDHSNPDGSGAACALVRSNPVGVKLGDELSGELKHFATLIAIRKVLLIGIASHKRKAFRVNREMADGYLRGKKISALKLLSRFVNSIADVHR
jgi:hypothetical protein